MRCFLPEMKFEVFMYHPFGGFYLGRFLTNFKFSKSHRKKGASKQYLTYLARADREGGRGKGEGGRGKGNKEGQYGRAVKKGKQLFINPF